MANNAVINNIYNYYLTTYAPKTDTKFDTHKKSELRGVYNSIVKMNKEDPLFIVDTSQSTKEYAVGLKENAREFRNTIASLGGLDDDELLNQKAAFSSKSAIADAYYIGDNADADSAPSFDLEVTKLASTQTNIGKMIPSGELSLPDDLYSFDIAVNGLNYEFQYNVYDSDTNLSLQQKLSRLITNAGIGLDAQVIEDGNGNSAIRIESQNTGRSSNGPHMFTVSDNNTSKRAGSVDYFGLDNIINESGDAEFLINGEPRHASGNIFTVEKTYEIHLKNISSEEGDSTNISLKPDVESLAANITKLIDGYNSFVDKADAYSAVHPKSDRLVREMSAIASLHSDELMNLGIELKEDGRIALDEDRLKSAAASGELKDNADALKGFTSAMLRKTNQVGLNPMNYADRTIVAYKNPGHNYATPYVTSAYTGMMFSSYC
ncbi:MAG: flagellar filament capping protein FliD [Lachnospiraceae bacterium]|nr:flagellar filament capping protein FliD [Lachnospiraceae bacterium]MBO7601077.1 flagellar filament capping protein FliD [Lachnospiraceae bacterium]